MVKGRFMWRAAHRVASVISVRPASRRAPMARLRSVAMILGPDRVLIWGKCSVNPWDVAWVGGWVSVEEHLTHT